MIRFNDVHAIKLIAAACHVQFVPTLHHCIARYDRNDMLMGGVLYTDFLGGSVQLHAAGFQRNWGNKQLLFLMFHYPFEQLGVKKIIGLVPEWNIRSRNATLNLGYRIEYKVDDVFNRPGLPNGMYIMSMLKADCRFLKMKLPYIDVAPPERTNRIDPLSIVDHTQMTVQ
jgi:hypothetical protein